MTQPKRPTWAADKGGSDVGDFMMVTIYGDTNIRHQHRNCILAFEGSTKAKYYGTLFDWSIFQNWVRGSREQYNITN